MSDRMRPVPFSGLLERIAGELRNHGSIFGIDSSLFFEDRGRKKAKVFLQECSVPVGPAAGPHTQLAQNIIAAYLSGARFIELKTVQIMDRLEIEKPCIDARDEGYNVEWSTEFTLEKAADEYIKAWIILHILEGAMKGRIQEKPSFIFNASVGYNLEGIKQERMQTFINTISDASGDLFDDYIAEAESLLEDNIFEGTNWEGSALKAAKDLDRISDRIASSPSGGLVIYDYKKGSAFSSADLGDKSLQFYIYRFLAERELHRHVERAAFVTIADCRISDADLSLGDDGMLSVLDEAADGMRNGRWIAIPDDGRCGRCGFRTICRRRFSVQ